MNFFHAKKEDEKLPFSEKLIHVTSLATFLTSLAMLLTLLAIFLTLFDQKP